MEQGNHTIPSVNRARLMAAKMFNEIGDAIVWHG